jgi:hypothetical protein
MKQNFKTLEGEMRAWLVPANIQIMMTGAARAMQEKSGRITLTYTDGETETAMCDHDIDEFDSWFHLVGFVQQGRALP